MNPLNSLSHIRCIRPPDRPIIKVTFGSGLFEAMWGEIVIGPNESLDGYEVWYNEYHKSSSDYNKMCVMAGAALIAIAFSYDLEEELLNDETLHEWKEMHEEIEFTSNHTIEIDDIVFPEVPMSGSQ